MAFKHTSFNLSKLLYIWERTFLKQGKKHLVLQKADVKSKRETKTGTNNS